MSYIDRSLRPRPRGLAVEVERLLAYATYCAAMGFAAAVVFGLLG